jgi:cytochrome c
MLVLASIAIAPSNVRAQQKVTYDDNVLPIVTQRCSRCHSEEKQKGGLLATTYAGILAGSSGGAVLVAGEPEQSNLYLSITHQREPNMPPGGEKIPQNEIDTIRKWIEGGLLENGGSKAKAKKKKSGPDLKAAIVTLGKPAEPPPLPKDLLLEPVVTSARAGALESLAANPWAPLVALGGQQQVLLVQWGSSTATNAAATAAAGAPAAASPPELVGILPFPEGLPQCLAFSRDGRTLIASGGRGATSGRVVGWSVADGKRLFEVAA